VRILALDDELMFRTMYEDFFGMQHGVTVDTVATVADALARLDGDDYDVVITDFYLNRADGEGDGRDLVDTLVQRGRGELIVVGSGSTNERIEVELREKGVARVFSKPFRFDELWAFIEGNAPNRNG